MQVKSVICSYFQKLAEKVVLKSLLWNEMVRSICDNLANTKSSRQKIAEYLQRSSGFET